MFINDVNDVIQSFQEPLNWWNRKALTIDFWFIQIKTKRLVSEQQQNKSMSHLFYHLNGKQQEALKFCSIKPQKKNLRSKAQKPHVIQWFQKLRRFMQLNNRFRKWCVRLLIYRSIESWIIRNITKEKTLTYTYNGIGKKQGLDNCSSM